MMKIPHRTRTGTKRLRSAVYAAAAIVLLLMLPALAAAAEVGVFTRVEGRVDILRPGAHATVTAYKGTIVGEGDIVRTKSDGHAEIVFKDDTVLDIAPGSRLKIELYAFKEDGSREQGLISLMRGKVRSVVSKVKARVVPAAVGTSTYKVRTPTTVMGVKGTDVFVSYRRGITEVVFREGSGFVYNHGLPGDEVHLVAGQATLVVGPEAPPMTPRHVSDMELTSHMQDTSPAVTVDNDNGRGHKHGADDGKQASNNDKDRRKKHDDDDDEDGHHDRNRVYSYTNNQGADWLDDAEHTAGLENDDHDDNDGHHHHYGSSDDHDNYLLPYTEANSTGLDNTAPVTIFTDRPDRLEDKSSQGFDLASSESVTYSYRLDGGPWQTTGHSFNLYGLSKGRHTIEIRSTDAASNTSTVTYDWFYSPGLSRLSYTGAAETTLTVDAMPMGTSYGRPFTHSGQINVIGAGDWGGWYSYTTGSYSGIPTPSAADVTTVFNDGTLILGTVHKGQNWSAGVISGTAAGFGADHTTGATWVSAGETFGTFDPATETWSSLDLGTMVGTSALVAMLDTGGTPPSGLIPFAEVGRASLTGNNGNLDVSMRDVRFLAYSTGEAPRVWATGSVSGTYATLPTTGEVVPLSGSGLSADFTAVKWQGGTWLSTVNGGGTYTGTGTLDGSSVSIDGAAAGTYTGGSFTGTGAGIAQ